MYDAITILTPVIFVVLVLLCSLLNQSRKDYKKMYEIKTQINENDATFYNKRIANFQDQLKKISQQAASIQKVKYTSLKVFDVTDPGFIHNIAQIGMSEPFRFLLHRMEQQAIAAAKGGNGEEQVRAIKWLEGFDLLNTELNRFVTESQKLSSIEGGEGEDGEEISLS